MRRLACFLICCAALSAVAIYIVHAARDPVTADKIQEIWALKYVESGDELFRAGRTEEAKASYAAALALNASETGRIRRYKLSAKLRVLIIDDALDAAERLSMDAIAGDSDLLSTAIDVISSSLRAIQGISTAEDEKIRERVVKEDRMLHWAVALALAHDTARPLFRDSLDIALSRRAGVDKVLQPDPTDAAGYVIRGYVHVTKSEYDLAIADYDRAIDLRPASAMIYELRGDAYHRLPSDAYQGKNPLDLAIADYTQAITYQQNDAVLWRDRGSAHYIKRENELAIRDYDKAIELDPMDFLAYVFRGETHYASEEYDLAIGDYSKAIELDTGNALTFSTFAERGKAHHAKKEYELAIRDYSKAIELHPNSYDYLSRGDVYAAQEKYDLAFRDYNKAIELDPKYKYAYHRRIDAYFVKEQYELAVRDYSKLIELDPKDADSYLKRGVAHLAMGENGLAIEDATSAFELVREGGGAAVALYTRAEIRFAIGDFVGAAADLAKTIELEDEADVYDIVMLYLAHSRAGDTAAEAEFKTNAAHLTARDWPYPVVELYLGTRMPDAALEAATQPSERCEAQFYIGEWHLLKGQKTDAEAAFKVAMEQCPKNLYTRIYARAELKRL